MEETMAVKADLAARFPSLLDKVRIQRPRRIYVDVPCETLSQILATAVKDMRFSILCTITGLDLGAQFGVIYHLSRESGVTLNISASLPKDKPVLSTITAMFPAAELYEREMVDLLGIQVQGLPEGPRYPLPDDWPDGQYPLRKDWDPSSLGKAADASHEEHHHA